ncbi:hypothetical protein CFC35_05735 [Streptomyces sp. FBKL.4005]|uniref:hypothetical protein n=1 Tax=Streptomyces sp. FBKL.4005 TaxID=2015515 RepID=UPI000B97AD65|nr:hypothetical protein [Streptomyces sp. FBKL.4005]OYP14066.1 hypothetical protein CFC35_05735 [Streptomyces sp. FBKL.4005]
MADQGTHFWFMTFIAVSEQGTVVVHHDGHITPPPNTTRYDLKRALEHRIVKQYPELSEAKVIAFEAQPNQL